MNRPEAALVYSAVPTRVHIYFMCFDARTAAPCCTHADGWHGVHPRPSASRLKTCALCALWATRVSAAARQLGSQSSYYKHYCSCCGNTPDIKCRKSAPPPVSCRLSQREVCSGYLPPDLFSGFIFVVPTVFFLDGGLTDKIRRL